MAVVIMYEINQFAFGDGYPSSIADVCVFLMQPLNYTMIMILPIILTSFRISKFDFIYNFTIRQNSWKQIWKKQIKQIAIMSLVFALFFVICIVIFSLGKKIPLFNWNVKQSFFFWRTEIILNFSAAEIYIYFLVCCFLRNFILQNIILLLEWFGIPRLIGVICIIVISLDEAVRGMDRLVSRLITADYAVWTNSSYRIETVIQTLVYFFMGYILYQIAINRKEIKHCGKV